MTKRKTVKRKTGITKKAKSQKSKDTALIKAVNEDGSRFRALIEQDATAAKAREEWRSDANKELMTIADERDKELSARPWYVKLYKKFF